MSQHENPFAPSRYPSEREELPDVIREARRLTYWPASAMISQSVLLLAIYSIVVGWEYFSYGTFGILSLPNVRLLVFIAVPLLIWCGLQFKKAKSEWSARLGALLAFITFPPLGSAICIWSLIIIRHPTVQKAFVFFRPTASSTCAWTDPVEVRGATMFRVFLGVFSIVTLGNCLVVVAGKSPYLFTHRWLSNLSLVLFMLLVLSTISLAATAFVLMRYAEPFRLAVSLVPSLLVTLIATLFMEIAFFIFIEICPPVYGNWPYPLLLISQTGVCVYYFRRMMGSWRFVSLLVLFCASCGIIGGIISQLRVYNA